MSKKIASIIFICVSFVMSCSKTTVNESETKQLTEQEILFESEELKRDLILAKPEAENLNKLVKENKLDEIFDNSSYCFKQIYTKDEFISDINIAISELKSTDPNLEILENKILDSRPPYVFNLVKGYRVGKIAPNVKFAYIMTYWQKEGEKMRFCGYQVLNQKQDFVGTKSCAVTKTQTSEDDNFKYTERTIVIDSKDSFTVKEAIPREKPMIAWLN
jgi:hypothetical protein